MPHPATHGKTPFNPRVPNLTSKPLITISATPHFGRTEAGKTDLEFFGRRLILRQVSQFRTNQINTTDCELGMSKRFRQLRQASMSSTRTI